MMTRRLGAMSQEGSSLRFYKIFTIFFLCISFALLVTIVFMITKRANIVVVAEPESKQINFAIKVSSTEIADSNAVVGAVTTTVFSWSKKYTPSGSKTVEGTSRGELTIMNKTSAPMTLIPKTRFSNKTGIVFRLKNRTSIPANGQVRAEVYADQQGSTSDIGPDTFILPALSEDKQNLIYAVSSEAMAGGSSSVGILSKEDVVSAEADFKSKIEETYALEHPVSAPTDRLFVHVLDIHDNPNELIGTQAKEFVLSGTSTLLVVTYSADQFDAMVQKQISLKIDQKNEKIISITEKPMIGLDRYDSSKKEVSLSFSGNVMVGIDEAAESLSPEKFVGMKRENIESYLKSLPHVAGAEVTISPLWARSAPEVAQKIKVVVKNVK